MRKIIFILALMAFAGTASSQTLNPFPTNDSLRKFINKWIRNSPIDAFTNLRLNTALIGMTRFIDSADAAGSAVTGFVAINDSTIRLTTNNLDTFYATLPGRYFAKNAVTKRGDTLLLGGNLTEWTWIKTYSNRSETPVAPLENALVLGNEVIPDSSNYWWLSANNSTTNIYDKSNIYLSRTYTSTANDTVYKNYGGNISATTFTRYDSSHPRYKNPLTPIVLPYGIMSANHILHPPDTAIMQTSPYGHFATIGADFRIGAARAYRVDIHSQSNISGPYPITVYRGGIDLAHKVANVKRESYGNGYVSYVSDFRNHQLTVNAGSTELGSYVSKIGGFYAYGNLAPFTSSPSKAKTLAVSTADTVFGFWAAPQYTVLNETKNGYGFIAQGTEDDNHFAGRFRLGGSLPLHATVMRRFHNTGTSELTDTVYMSKLLKLGTGTAAPTAVTGFNIYADSGLQVGYSYGNRVYASIAQYQTGITAANYSAKRTKGLIVEMDWEYSDPSVDITDKFQRAVLGYGNIIADSFINVTSVNGGVGANEFGLLYRKKTGYLDTTVFKGGSTPSTAPFGLRGTLDMTGGGLISSRANRATGYHTALDARVAWGAWHRIDNAIWFQTGAAQPGGPNAQIDTGYQIYMLPSDATVLTKYGIYQAGTADSNVLYGPSRHNNILQTEYSGAQNTITSTTALGSTSGGTLSLFAMGTPSTSSQNLGFIEFGSRISSNNRVGATIRALSSGAWTDGSVHRTDLIFSVTASGSATPSVGMRLNGGGRLFVGANTVATATVELVAGTTSVAPIKLNSGSLLSSYTAGTIEYDGVNFYQSNALSRGVLEKTRNQVINNSTFTIDGTASHYVFSGTTSTWTLPAIASSMNMTIHIKNRGSGSITLNSNIGGNDIYDTSATNTITIAANASAMLSNDGTYFNVYRLP